MKKHPFTVNFKMGQSIRGLAQQVSGRRDKHDGAG